MSEESSYPFDFLHNRTSTTTSTLGCTGGSVNSSIDTPTTTNDTTHDTDTAPVQPSRHILPYTPREYKFVAEYISNGGNSRKAALLAKYSASEAVEAHTWITRLREDSTQPQIWDLYQERVAGAQIKAETTVDRIIEEYSNIAFADPGEIFDKFGNVIPIRDIPRNTRHAISKIKLSYDKMGNQVYDISMIDKRGSLDSLAKIMGMFREQLTVTHSFAGLLDNLDISQDPLVIESGDVIEITDQTDQLTTKATTQEEEMLDDAAHG